MTDVWNATDFIMTGYSDTESDLHFMPVFDVPMLNDMFYKIKEKSNDKINSTLQSIHWNIQFVISPAKKQVQPVPD
jgi:hypothetical protein